MRQIYQLSSICLYIIACITALKDSFFNKRRYYYIPIIILFLSFVENNIIQGLDATTRGPNTTGNNLDLVTYWYYYFGAFVNLLHLLIFFEPWYSMVYRVFDWAKWLYYY
jgi:hypothetical protein